MRRTSSRALRTASRAWSISRTVRGHCLGDRVQLEEHTREQLADLVVQVAGDPDPLGLLRGEHPAAVLVPFALEPVEHLIEGRDDAADLVAAPDRKTLARPQQIHCLHAPGELLERHERASQQEGISHDRDREPSEDDQRLRCADRRIDLDRGHKQKHRDRAEEPRVDREDAPEERQTHQ